MVKAAAGLGSASNYDFTGPFKFSSVYWASLHVVPAQEELDCLFLKKQPAVSKKPHQSSCSLWQEAELQDLALAVCLFTGFLTFLHSAIAHEPHRGLCIVLFASFSGPACLWEINVMCSVFVAL